eukprot:TRINITY_DN58627_c0_g1_i1.p1 TRINITY_DN58627_c0_g1~~TRINITY_DN58627_c0_g1_i1.p1  ORF type:complete len:255 (+),score=41.83 TRINITY_DN58627_c0_g1_i1:152-916(+)
MATDKSNDVEAAELEIQVMYINGHALGGVRIVSTASILQLKEAIQAEYSIPCAQQSLFAGDVELSDSAFIRNHQPLINEPIVTLIDGGVELVLSKASVAFYSGANVAEAAQAGAFRDVIRLVQARADINSRHDYEYSALHHMACVPGCPDGVYDELNPSTAAKMMQWLIDQAADVNQGDTGGKTPLHVLGKYGDGGNTDQLRTLLSARANINQGMNYGEEWTPLWYVRYYRVPAWREFEAILTPLGARQIPDEL